ncbi:MAG TPA: hypothetical protein VGF99_10445, partial [Myxococcota bacterium]
MTQADLRIDFDDGADALIEGLKRVPNPITLSVGYIKEDSDLSPLSSLTSVRELEVSAGWDEEGIKLPAGLGDIALEKLTLGHIDLSSLPRIPSLRELVLEEEKHPAAAIDIVAEKLPQLRALSIDGEDVKEAPIPASLGALTNLESLKLTSCGITGLPDEIGALTSLQTLEIEAENGTAIPASIGTLTALRELEWSGELPDNGLPSSMSSLSSLQKLQLIRAFKADKKGAVLPKVLGTLEALADLNIRGCHVDSLAVLAGLENLKRLTLSSGRVDDVASLAQLTQLEALDLDYWVHAKHKDFETVSSLTNLHTLELRGCKGIKDLAFLAPLTKLKNLYVDDIKPAALSLMFEAPLIDRLELDADPDSPDFDYEDETVVALWKARTLRRLPSIAAIKQALANADDAESAEKALEDALRFCQATSTEHRRALGIVFGDEDEPPPPVGKKK